MVVTLALFIDLIRILLRVYIYHALITAPEVGSRSNAQSHSVGSS